MSKQIDERVVSMEFDNRQFESNVKTTMSTLDKLKQSLDLKGASKGLENVNDAAKSCNLSPLSNAAETVKLKFSALEVMAVTALANITNSAVNAGKRMVSALTIDPIKTGFQEYETQINAVQTILANTSSKGTTLNQVNAALDELNHYADKTIYNFTEMTRNIGTFTAAGVDLKTSVSAIQGIANLAAVSGSTSQQASTAMYQLSQALAAGTVKLMDWNSVVNAGMGGQVFQDALMQTARVHGIAIDRMIKEEGSFRETLSKGWLTSDILTETLNQFTMAAEEGTEEWEAYKKSLMDTGYTEDQAVAILKMANTATDAATKVKTFTQLWDTLKESAQSGWTESWEIMIGDFEEAKGFLTEVSDVVGSMIGETAEARNKVLSEGLSSGWKQLLGAGIADEEGYKEIFKSVAEEHGTSIDQMIAAEKELDNSLTDTEAFQKALKKGFNEGTLSSDMLTESVHKMAEKMSNMSTEELKAAGYTQDHVKQIKELSAGLKDGSISMDDFVKKIQRPSGRENIIQALWNSFNGLISVIKPIKEAFREVFPAMTGEQLYKLTEQIRDLTAKFKLSEEQTAKLKSTFKGLFSAIDIGVTFVKEIVSGIASLISNFTGLGGGILDATSSFGDWITNVRDSIKETNLFGNAVDKVVGFLQKVIDKIKEFFSFIKGKFSMPGFDGFLNILKSIWNLVQKVCGVIANLGVTIGKALGNAFQNGDIKSLIDILNGGIFTTILLGLKNWIGGFKDFANSGAGFVDTIKDVLGTVGDSLQAWQEKVKYESLQKIAISIGILAASLFVISRIDPERLGSALGSIAVLFGELLGSMKLFDKLGIEMKGSAKIVTLMIGMSAAILILSSALKSIASLGWEELARGLAGILGLMTILVAAVKVLSNDSKKVLKGATQMVIMAAALKILASVCKDLSTLSWEELGKGLAGVGALLLEISIFSKIMQSSKIGLQTATSIVLISAALKILASACSDFGAMSWSEIGKGLASIAALLLEIAVFSKLTGNAKNLLSTSAALILIGASMKIFASAVQDFGSMSWSEIGKGLTTFAASLLAVAVATKIMPKNMVSIGVGLIAVAAALLIVANVLTKLGGQSWEEIAKGLVSMGGAIAILAIGLNAMNKTLAGSAALLVATISLAMLVPILKSLGGMSWEQIAKGLISIAGAFIIIGVAGKVLGPMVGTILALSGAVALFGIGCLATGAGILALSIALGALASVTAAGATAIVAALGIIIIGILELIPSIIDVLTDAVVALCEVFIRSVPAIGEAIRVLVVEIIKILVECVPALAEGAYKLIVGVLEGLVSYMPQIIDLLFQFLISVFDGIAQNLPALIQSIVNVFTALFKGVIDALNNVDPEILVKGILGIGFLSAMMIALAGMAALTPLAMVGVLGVGAVITELAIVLAAIGALSQIPGLDWLVSEAGNLLQAIGTAIGQFIGGIAGGIAEGVTSTLPQVGTNLSQFMTNLHPFIEGASMFDASTLEGVRALVDVILALTGANILDGIASWITGESSLTKFGEEIAEFGPYIKQYADSVQGIDASAVEASVNAAKCLSELASNLPNSGGLAGFFAGENDIGNFGAQLIPFGIGMKAYSDAIAGFNPEAVIASVNAAQAISDMASTIPNEGGVAAWFAGDNSISKFGTDLVELGTGLKSYSDAIAGFNPEAVIASVNAAKALAEMTSNIPNEGGMVAWFTGENSISKFGDDIVELGSGLKAYSDVIVGFNAEAVIASANAAKALAEMTACIPNEGGMVAWFTGENSISKFGNDLISLGVGLLGFSVAVTGVNTENVIAAANAARALAEMANTIPNEGGMVAWFTGENSISKFGSDLIALGVGLLGFSTSVSGINAENVIAAANAAKVLAEMANTIPNEGGMVAWFTGESSISKFGSELTSLGLGLLGFSVSVAGINAESMISAANAAKVLAEMTSYIPSEGGVTAWFTGERSISKFGSELTSLGLGLLGFSVSVSGINTENITAGANAAKALAEMTSYIPSEGGMKAWFTGESSVAKFATNLPLLGAGLLGFSVSVAGIDTEKITAAANAAKALAEMTTHIPTEGGIKAWFTGKTSIATFADKLPTLGTGLKGFSDSVKGINPENVTAAAKAAKSLGEMTSTIPKNTDKIKSFGDNLVKFGEKLKTYFDKTSSITAETISTTTNATDAINKSVSSIKPDTIKSAVSAIKELIKMFKDLSGIKESSTTGFTNAIKKLGKINSEALLKSYKDAYPKMTKAGETMITKFIDGIKKKESSPKDAIKKVVSKCADAIQGKSGAFKTAGGYLVEGFAQGITAKTYLAKAKAKAMAEAAEKAARDALGIHSPSLVFTELGGYIVKGLAEGITKDTSAEEAIEKKAQNIETAFKNEVEKLDLADTRLDLENSLNGKSNGLDDATTYASKYERQLKRVNLAQAKYNMLVENSGESSNEALKAYNEYLQEQVDLKNMETDRAEAIEKTNEEMRNSKATALDLADSQVDLQKSLFGTNSEFNDGSIYTSKYNRQLERITAAQEKYNEAVSKYGESSNEAKEAHNNWLQEQINLQDLAYNHSVDWIEQQKKLGEFSLIDELSAWKRVQSAYAEGTDKRIEADSKVLEIEQSIESANNDYYNNVIDRTKELSEAQEELTQKYKDALDERKKAIVDSYGLFDKVEEKEEVKGADLIDNLMSQFENNMLWSTNITKLTDRGILSDEIISKLREMGPSAAKEIEALTSMTDFQLEKYNRVWESNNKVAENQAALELTGLKDEIAKENETLIKDYNTDLETLRTDWLKSLGIMSTDTVTEFSKLVSDSVKTVGDQEKWSEAGANTIEGIIKGINDNESLLKKAIETLGGSVLTTFNNALGIHSPSREFAKSGMFIVQGIRSGIINNANDVYDSISDVGSNSVRSFTNVLSKLSDVINSDMDVQPVISPVIDLSDAKAGIRSINDMFGDGISLGANGNLGVVSSMMNARIQNGFNNDVVSAIDKVRDRMDNIKGTTYNIDGITYDDGSDVAEAIKTLVRAAKIERRT